MRCLTDCKKSVWSTTLPSQLIGSPHGSSDATFPVGRFVDIDRALENVDRADEFASARELVERKRRAMSSLARDVQQRRLAGVLSRRGFDSAVISRVLSDVLRD
jgi:hypothetical protein